MKKTLGFDVIIIGEPASGKDTQAKLLRKMFAFKLVKSGDYLRNLARHQTQLGIAVRNALSRGLPAPTRAVKEFLKSNVRSAPTNSDLLFVGNPRLKPEAEFLRNLLVSNKRDFLVIYITLPAKEIWKRSEQRMRGVEDAKYVSTRIRWTKLQVGKTRKYFEKLKKLRLVNGNQTIKAVNKDIIKVTNDYKRSKAN
jgi:UMP-CMP kinase